MDEEGGPGGDDEVRFKKREKVGGEKDPRPVVSNLPNFRVTL